MGHISFGKTNVSSIIFNLYHFTFKSLGFKNLKFQSNSLSFQAMSVVKTPQFFIDLLSVLSALKHKSDYLPYPSQKLDICRALLHAMTAHSLVLNVQQQAYHLLFYPAQCVTARADRARQHAKQPGRLHHDNSTLSPSDIVISSSCSPKRWV